MDKKEIVEQTDLAFDFVNKLYLEVSVLIKEIEGLLKSENEEFVIAKPGGYSVTSPKSSGLEYVDQWLIKKLSVSFIPKSMTELKKGGTITPFNDELKILYIRFILFDGNIKEPIIQIGRLHNFEIKDKGQKYFKKFENSMTHIEWNDLKFFSNPENINYEDVYFKCKGEFIDINLYDINKSEEVLDKILKPALEIFRK